MKKLIALSCFISLCLLLSHSGYSQLSLFNGYTVVKSLDSPALEGNLQGHSTTQNVRVYLPRGYNDFPCNKYPVIYLLHCYGQGSNGYYNAYNLLNTVNKMISDKTIIPMIIVTPNASTAYKGSFYTNSYVSGNWEDYIIQDVLQHVKSKYRVLDQQESRGLSGFSMGGYGTAKIGMKHSSLFKALAMIGAPNLDLEEQYFNPPWKDHLIQAASINEYRDSDPWYVHASYAIAVAFAPDSTAKPVLGRLPYTADSVLIDSIWQQWLLHDPYTMLPLYKDSLLKYNTIQMYVGESDDLLPNNETFHQALLDNGIEHGYTIFKGAHNPTPVLDDLLCYFSEQLSGIIPTLHTSSAYILDLNDTLEVETDMDGTLYFVPLSADEGLNSILMSHVATIPILANEPMEIPLAEYPYGSYRVYAVTSDSAVSNIPVEFSLVYIKSPPLIDLKKDTVPQGDSIRVSMDRDGTICLLGPYFGGDLDTFQTAPEIITSPILKASSEARAGEEISFSTNNLSKRTYCIYGYDQYGIVAGPVPVEVAEQTAVSARFRTSPAYDIALFPNPVREILTIQSSVQGLFEMEINSLNGQLVFRSRFKGSSHQLDLSYLKKGIYFITIRSKDFVTTRKIIKM